VVLQAPAPLDAVFTPDVLAPALVRTCLARGVAVGGHVLHRFVPQGASVLLHGPAVRLALHTWPERGVATLDVLLPGEGPEDAQALVEAVAAALGMCVIEAHAPGRAG
jgi:S-adenosylmethionine/arginine decarboxylase-like enzyme